MFDERDYLEEDMVAMEIAEIREEYEKQIKEYLTKDELRILYQFLAPMYVSYENVPLLELVKKIRTIVDG